MADVNKTFTLSFAELALFASQTASNMTRDTVQFTVRGVNSAAITAFQVLVNAFEIFPPDEVYVGEIKDLTSEKNALRETVTTEIQQISGFFEQKWGIGSGKYTSLRVGGLQKMSESNFLLTARNVVTQATAYLADLTAIGLTQPMIDSLEDNAQLLEDKLIALNAKKELRNSKAVERITKGNELYDFVSLYCKTGKLIWENTDPAKYSDYIIYKTSHPGLSKPQNVLPHWDPGDLAITLSWDLVTGATRYEVFVSIVATGSPSGNYNLLNTFTSSPQLIPPVSGKRNYFKIKAKNDTQTSDYSDEAWVEC